MRKADRDALGDSASDLVACANAVGAYSGSKSREASITVDEWERMQGHRPDDAAPSRPKAIIPPRMEEEAGEEEVDEYEEQDELEDDGEEYE